MPQWHNHCLAAAPTAAVINAMRQSTPDCMVGLGLLAGAAARCDHQLRLATCTAPPKDAMHGYSHAFSLKHPHPSLFPSPWSAAQPLGPPRPLHAAASPDLLQTAQPVRHKDRHAWASSSSITNSRAHSQHTACMCVMSGRCRQGAHPPQLEPKEMRGNEQHRRQRRVPALQILRYACRSSVPTHPHTSGLDA